VNSNEYYKESKPAKESTFKFIECPSCGTKIEIKPKDNFKVCVHCGAELLPNIYSNQNDIIEG